MYWYWYCIGTKFGTNCWLLFGPLVTAWYGIANAVAFSQCHFHITMLPTPLGMWRVFSLRWRHVHDLHCCLVAVCVHGSAVFGAWTADMQTMGWSPTLTTLCGSTAGKYITW